MFLHHDNLIDIFPYLDNLVDIFRPLTISIVRIETWLFDIKY